MASIARPSLLSTALLASLLASRCRTSRRSSAKRAASVYLATGSSLSVASGRLSFAMGLQGPCAAYITACSASLTAYHAARRSAQLDECKGAMAAGVNMMLLPGTGIALGLAGMTSALGRCHTFDARADGYARGEATVGSDAPA